LPERAGGRVVPRLELRLDADPLVAGRLLELVQLGESHLPLLEGRFVVRVDLSAGTPAPLSQVHFDLRLKLLAHWHDNQESIVHASAGARSGLPASGSHPSPTSTSTRCSW